MTEKRFKAIDENIWQGNEIWCVAGGKHCADVIATAMNELIKENEQLKEALREELQDNGNAYDIEIFDKLFNLNYDEWDRNERYRECTDWEKVLKDKGDVE